MASALQTLTCGEISMRGCCEAALFIAGGETDVVGFPTA